MKWICRSVIVFLILILPYISASSGKLEAAECGRDIQTCYEEPRPASEI